MPARRCPRRVDFLTMCLYSDSEEVRYRAAMGLASLDDPATLPFLTCAIEREHYADLRTVYAQVIAQIEGKS